MAGSLIVGNAVRGYTIFGRAKSSGLLRAAVVIGASIVAVFSLFLAWQMPFRGVAALQRSASPWGRALAAQAWLFGPIIAKFVATILWSGVLVLWYYLDLRYAFGPGLVVASYAPALAFTILEVQQLEIRP
jgi:hypothetical protein